MSEEWANKTVDESDEEGRRVTYRARRMWLDRVKKACLAMSPKLRDT